MGQQTTAAARNLRLLSHPDLRKPPTTGPATGRRTPSTTPAAPLDLGLLDYLTDHVDEIVTHARTHGSPTLPMPDRNSDPGDLYDWWIDNTGTADIDEQRYRDTVIERHALEHAIRLGDHDAVGPHPCPACGSWGLFWDQRGNRARCSDTDCRTPDGTASAWTLARLAAQKVERTEIWRRNAT